LFGRRCENQASFLRFTNAGYKFKAAPQRSKSLFVRSGLLMDSEGFTKALPTTEVNWIGFFATTNDSTGDFQRTLSAAASHFHGEEADVVREFARAVFFF
jgi:hypothetical protein